MTVWNKTKLGKHTLKVGSGITPKGGSDVYLESGVPFIRSQNVLNNKLNLNDVVYIDNAQHKKMRNSVVQSGDVLLNITGASIGRSCVVPEQIQEANVNQHVCIIRAKEDELDNNYLCQFLNSAYGQKIITSFQAGGNRQGLNYEQIKSFPLELPPLEEQRKIAQILSTWDEAIETTEDLIFRKEKHKKNLLRNVLEKLFESDIVKKRIDEIAKISRGRVISKNYIEMHKGIYPVYSSQTSNNGEMGRIDSYDYDGEFVTWTTDGANAGTVFYRRGKFNCTNICGVLEVKDKSVIDTRFLSIIIQPEAYKKTARNLANPKLMSNIVQTIKVPIPDIQEQKSISQVVSLLENSITLLKQKLSLLKRQKNGLTQRLLTGKVRVN